MGRTLFVNDKERRFFAQLTKEVVQRIISQEIIYYSVSTEDTKVDDLYNEAINKTVYAPVVINALVLYKDPQNKADKFSLDTVYEIEAYVAKSELAERNLSPLQGDFLSFGDVFYEIIKLTEPQLYYGQVGHKVMWKMECRVAREGQFKIENIKG